MLTGRAQHHFIYSFHFKLCQIQFVRRVLYRAIWSNPMLWNLAVRLMKQVAESMFVVQSKTEEANRAEKRTE